MTGHSLTAFASTAPHIGAAPALAFAAVVAALSAGLTFHRTGRPVVARLLALLTALVAGGYVVGIAVGEPTGRPVLVVALYSLAGVTAIAGAWRAAWRPPFMVLAGALVAYGACATAVTLLAPSDGYPVWGALGFVAFYPGVFATLALILRRRLPQAPLTLWVDIAIGGVALAAVADFALLHPLDDHAISAFAVSQHIFALCDVLVLGTLVAACAVTGWRPGRQVGVLAAGVTLMTVADAAFLVELVHGAMPTTLSFAGWTAAFVVLSWTAWAPPARPAPAAARRRRVGVPVAMGALSVPLLVLGDSSDVAGMVNVGLAALVLVLVTVRLMLTLRANAQLLQCARAEGSRTAAILSSAGGGIVGVDADGRVSFANPAALALTGGSQTDVVGRPCSEVLVVEDDTVAVALADTLTAGTAQPPADVTLISQGGWGTAVQCTMGPIELDGIISGAVISIVDVTERQEAAAAVRSSEEHLAMAQRMAGIGSWQWTAATDRVHWSEQQALLHGVASHRVPRDTGAFYELVVDDDRAEVMTAFDRAWCEGTPMDVVYRVPLAEGPRLIRAVAERLHDADGTPIGMAGTTQDVTDRLRREEAERASRAKSDFMSRMSHELRTPLNAILGFGQLLEMSDLDARQRTNVEQILTAGDHLLGLINEVLDIARIEAGRLSVSFEPVDVAATVREAAQLSGPLAAERDVIVELDLPAGGAWARADAQRLRQIVLNLMSNGVKYNRRGGTLRLSVRADEQYTQLEVADTGHGIEPRDLDRLFQAFERISDDGDFVEGTGLGLAVTKGLVEAMDGRIAVESEVGTGTTFRVALPAAEARTLREAAGPDEVPMAEQASSGETVRRLLCIEDNLANLTLMRGILGGRGDLELAGAGDVASGVAAARRQPPDLVLLDLSLPDGHGSDVLRDLRDDPATAAVPVVVLSADATQQRIDATMAAGAAAYLTKPLDVLDLLTTVEDILSRAARRDR